FEKTTSVRQLMKDLQEGNNWYEQNKDRYPVSMVSYYDFTGDTSKSLYQPGKDVPVDPRVWYRPVGDKNVVYTDYRNRISISQKPVFEEVFLVEDSLLKIKWKLTSDVRTIAGYDCRKAVGILNDTIAIFAFYSDELLINGGPEGIQGLPGMILGMGIPRLHSTWFATKVEVFEVKMNKVVPSTKGKKSTRNSMLQALDKIAKDWGAYGSKLLINFII
ncbi:MAG: GLPGLI family protein, partial [Chitinophagaceae bacterium]